MSRWHREGEKRCAECGEVKPLAEFDRRSTQGDAPQAYCKPCVNIRRRRRAKADPDGWKAMKKRWWVKNEHGLTVEEYDAYLDAGCAICGCAEGRMNLDHDHETGTIREALCPPCNRAIGLLGDDPDRIQAAADYLRKHRQGVAA